jgi:uncharacterized protein (DUF1778 family)
MRPPAPSESLIMAARFASDAEVSLIKRAAQALGMSPSAFIRWAVLERARVTAEEPRREKQKRDAVKGRGRLVAINGGKK